MLYDVGQGRYVENIPLRDEYDAWRARLPDAQFDAIRTELHRRIDGSRIHTSSFIPGNDWTDTVYEPIYTDACRGDMHASGLCFGLFLWVVMMEHPEVWGFTSNPTIRSVEILGTTYFRLDNPPRK